MTWGLICFESIGHIAVDWGAKVFGSQERPLEQQKPGCVKFRASLGSDAS